jgi:hypothetical protein
MKQFACVFLAARCTIKVLWPQAQMRSGGTQPTRDAKFGSLCTMFILLFCFANNNLLETYNRNQRRVQKTKSMNKRGKFLIQTFKLYQQQHLVGWQYVTTGDTNCSYRQQYVTTGDTNCS